LLGESKEGRDHLVEHAGGLSLRKGSWKLIPTSKGPKVNKNTNTETGADPAVQLYDLAKDPGEQTNVATANPEIAREMLALLERMLKEGAPH
jgi:arylsulfatase A-like enzyme